MFRLFEPRSTLERLQEKYTFLMRRSFELSLVDKTRSDMLNQKACTILQEIRRMQRNHDEEE